MKSFKWRCITINKKDKDLKKDQELVNEKIRIKEMLIIGPNGEQVGIRSREDALTLAEHAGLDLVLVNPNGTPPVAKLLDYGKYRYEQQRRSRENKKNQKEVQLKEIRLSPVIDIHDFDTRVKNAQKFLEKDSKVKVVVVFRGRQMAHTDLGKDVLNRFFEKLQDVATVEKEAKLEGRNMTMILTPKK